MGKLLKSKPFLVLSVAAALILITSFLNKDDTITAEPPDRAYAGEWRGLYNGSLAKVDILDNEHYVIAYNSQMCSINFVGTIYNIALKQQPLKVLRLDIDRDKSRCYFLDGLFAPNKFIFKFERLTSSEAILRIPTIDDLKLYLENTSASSAVKENLESMIKMIKAKNSLLKQAKQVKLEYKK